MMVLVDPSKRGLLLSLLIVLLIPLTLFAVSQRWELRKQAEESSAQHHYNLVVVGAGTSGVSAAIQAARMGAKVALLEETDWIGGQMTAAAVTSMDEGGFIRESGIYHEFVTRVKNYYQAMGKSVGTCYFTDPTICFEPSAGQNILKEMIDETKNQILPNGQKPVLDLYLRTRVMSVLTSGNAITGVATDTERVFQSKVVIDATEYGGVILLTPARYRVGNSTNDNINPDACIQDITYTAVIKKYPDGVPPELWLNNPPPGYTEDVKQEFKKIVAEDGSNWPGEWGKYPVNWPSHNAYRGMPDSSNPENYNALEKEKITKTGVNWANDYPSTTPYISNINPTLKVAYLEDRSFRKQANCEAKLKTLQFIYYVQHELGETLWSIANDEGFDTPYNIEENSCDNIPPEFKEIEKHFPPIPYVRESRRIIGMHTLTAGEIKRVGSPPKAQKSFKLALVIGDYHNDLHNCDSNATLEASLETRDDVPETWTTGPFQIPFESFIPQDVDGFLVAEKNLSVSRLVNGAIRLQPITMLSGQAAGALAAVAVQKSIQPRNVPPILVQKELLDLGCPLSLYTFEDAPRTHPFWADIQLASLYEIMIGYGNNIFGVDDPLLRAQVAVILTRLFDLPTDNPPTTPTFADVPPDYWAYPFIEAIYKAGITVGCSQNPRKFCPENLITRAELAVMLVKAMQLDPNDAPSEPIFEDVPPSHWAFPYVQLLAEKDIVGGCSVSPDLFCPENVVSRGEGATIASCILISGAIPTPTPTLTPGFNQIIWSAVSDYTASKALSDINSDCGGAAEAISRRKDGWWESAVYGYGGVNFNLSAHNLYYIKVASACFWTP